MKVGVRREWSLNEGSHHTDITGCLNLILLAVVVYKYHQLKNMFCKKKYLEYSFAKQFP